MAEKQLGWAWLRQDASLDNGAAEPGRPVEPGQKVRSGTGAEVVEHAYDGLASAPGPVLCCLQRSADIAELSGDGSSMPGVEWTILWYADASSVLRDFAVWCGQRIALVSTTQQDGDIIAGEMLAQWPLPQAVWRLARDLLWDWSTAAEGNNGWATWSSSVGTAWLSTLAEIDAELERGLSALATAT